MYDCWLAATTISVAAAQPTWFTNLIFTVDGQTMRGQDSPVLAEGYVQLWDMNSDIAHNFSVSARLQSRTEDRPGQRWWNSAIMQGFMAMSQVTGVPGILNGVFNEAGGDPGAALFALTGHSAVAKETRWYGGAFSPNETKLYDDMVAAHYASSPMVFTTWRGKADEDGLLVGSVLYRYHAYGLVKPRMYDNGTMTAFLRNPWGRTTEVGLRELITVMSWAYHLHDFVSLNWTAAINGDQPFWGTNLPQRLDNVEQTVAPLVQPTLKPAVRTVTATWNGQVMTYPQAEARYPNPAISSEASLGSISGVPKTIDSMATLTTAASAVGQNAMLSTRIERPLATDRSASNGQSTSDSPSHATSATPSPTVTRQTIAFASPIGSAGIVAMEHNTVIQQAGGKNLQFAGSTPRGTPFDISQGGALHDTAPKESSGSVATSGVADSIRRSDLPS